MAGDDASRRRTDEPADLDPEVVVCLDRIQRRVRERVAGRIEYSRQRAEEVLVPVELGALFVVAEGSYVGGGSLDVERLEDSRTPGTTRLLQSATRQLYGSPSAVKQCAVLVFRPALELDRPQLGRRVAITTRRARE